AVRRGGAAEHVRPARKGDGREEVIADPDGEERGTRVSNHEATDGPASFETRLTPLLRMRINIKDIPMIEFFFDCSSPWTYLAFHNIQPLAKELGVEISWRPILVGGIFNTVNPSVYASRETPVPLKARYMKKDLADWARSAGLAIKMPPTVFPVNSVKAMRGCIWLGNKDMVPFARAVFEAYWGGDKDISQDA